MKTFPGIAKLVTEINEEMNKPDDVFFCKECQRWFIQDEELEHFNYRPFPELFETVVEECPECEARLNAIEEEEKNYLIEHHEKKLQTALALLRLIKQADKKIAVNTERVKQSKKQRPVLFPELVNRSVHRIEITKKAKERIQSRFNLIMKEASNVLS